MSNFQNYYSFLIDIGSTLAQWQAEFKQQLTDNGWQVLAEHVPTATLLANQRGYLDVIPPISEQIGNAEYFEVTRFLFVSTGVAVRSFIRPVGAQTAQSFTLTNLSANISTMSFYLDSTLFTVTGVSGNTAAQNAILFYNYMVAHANELALMFNWSVNGAVITATAKSVKPFIDVLQAVANVSSSNLALGGQNTPGLILNKTQQYPLTIVSADFTNGFIYYLTINSRSIQLSTKTTTSYYGPMYAHYGDHATAVAQTPPNCLPIELVIGYSGNASSRLYGNGRVTHVWGASANYSGDIIPSWDTTYVALALKTSSDNYTVLSDLTSIMRGNGVIYSHNNQNYATDLKVSPFGINVTAYSSNTWYGEFTLFSGNAVLPNMLQSKTWEYLSGFIYTVAICPAINLEDIFIANFTATSESLHLIRNLTSASTLQTVMDAVSVYPNVVLADATFFATSGTFIVGSETFEYTGKSGDTLTGVSRAKYGTSMAIHALNDLIYPGNWMVKINGGLHMAGTVKPLN